MKRSCICRIHLNVLTFFPPDWGMLRRFRCILIKIYYLVYCFVSLIISRFANVIFSSTRVRSDSCNIFLSESAAYFYLKKNQLFEAPAFRKKT